MFFSSFGKGPKIINIRIIRIEKHFIQKHCIRNVISYCDHIQMKKIEITWNICDYSHGFTSLMITLNAKITKITLIYGFRQ